MAAKSLYIFDTYEAIKNNEIPGKLEKYQFVFPTIKSINSHGKELFWTIFVKLLTKDLQSVPIKKEYLKRPLQQLDNLIAEITVESYQKDGKVRQVVPTYIKKGKNIGKKNETNVLTQAIRDALSNYNRKAKINTSTKDTNKDIMPPPMLIKNNGDTKLATITEQDIQDGVIVQPKLNGVRVVTLLNGDNIVMYSREKSEYPGLDHIRNEQKKLLTFIKQLINDNLLFNSDGEPNNVWLPNNDPDICPIYLDGEIYKHGVSLLYIAGQSRRDTDNSDLEYHIFDLIFTTKMDMESKERQFILSEIFKMYTDYTFSMNGPLHYLHRVPNHKPNTLDEVFLLKDSYVRHGYEGIIVRRDSGLYKFSYNKARTSDIVKIKAKFTDEFKCIGYTQGEKGKDIGAIIWICETEDHKQFNVVPKNMTYQERYRIFEIVNTGDNFDKYIKGKMLTVEYDEISSKTGIPLRAKAEAFRTYESGDDPIAKLLAM